MPTLVYGVWDGVPYDNRKSSASKAPEDINLEAMEYFNEGNAISALVNDRGFLVFDDSVSLLWVMQNHFSKVASESCGKCSPCRTGAALLNRLLAQAMKEDSCDWSQIREIAEQMLETSLCGIGKTGPRPLLDAMSYFPSELNPRPQDMRHGFFL